MEKGSQAIFECDVMGDVGCELCIGSFTPFSLSVVQVGYKRGREGVQLSYSRRQ